MVKFTMGISLHIYDYCWLGFSEMGVFLVTFDSVPFQFCLVPCAPSAVSPEGLVR